MSLKNATIDVLRANKIVPKLKSQSVKLTFKSIGNILISEITPYSDASFVNLKDGKSQGVISRSRDQKMVLFVLCHGSQGS